MGHFIATRVLLLKHECDYFSVKSFSGPIWLNSLLDCCSCVPLFDTSFSLINSLHISCVSTQSNYAWFFQICSAILSFHALHTLMLVSVILPHPATPVHTFLGLIQVTSLPLIHSGVVITPFLSCTVLNMCLLLIAFVILLFCLYTVSDHDNLRWKT